MNISIQKHLNKLVFLFLFFNITACNFNKDESISIKVDYSLLSSSPFTDKLGFSVYLPEGLLELDDNSKKKIESVLKSDENTIQADMIGAYQSSDLSFCIISRLISNQEGEKNIPEDYLDVLQSQYASENINIANFKVNSMDIRQYTIFNKNHVVFKLFIYSENIYQLDYIIPVENYKKELVKIESSIGTITVKQ